MNVPRYRRWFSCALVIGALACGSDGARPGVAPGLAGVSPVPDGSVPAGASGPVAFFDMRVEELGSARAVVRFRTSEPTACEIHFGPAPGPFDRVATDPAMAPGERIVDHRVALEDLSPTSAYVFAAYVTDASGRLSTSAPGRFETPAGMANGEGEENVALLSAGARVVEVSSNWAGAASDDPAFGANNAIDGAMSTEWSTYGDGDGAFVALALGRERALRRFVFRSREMSDGTSIVTSVRLVVDGGASVLGPFATPNPAEAYAFAFAEPVPARLVRVEAVSSTGGNTGAREIQLYARD